MIRWRVFGRVGDGHGSDDGGATVWLLATGLLVVLLGAAMATAGAAVVARHRAQAAADLGALAGAPLAVDGEAAACRAAEAIVRANGAWLRRCWRQGVDLLVTVEVRPPGPAAVFGSAHASARAGPVAAVESARAPPGNPGNRGPSGRCRGRPASVVLPLSAWRVRAGRSANGKMPRRSISCRPGVPRRRVSLADVP
jgi:secretion/DNA translocation related TadE-like protein